ncbi:MAG: hypothetical protein M5U09_26555 [Gammaproteobacteria bacterium]|nr:hypothetical protein [Gammaproteobacteria bacterium]
MASPLAVLGEGGCHPASSLAACALLSLLRAELADLHSPLHKALDEDDFRRHWLLLTHPR